MKTFQKISVVVLLMFILTACAPQSGDDNGLIGASAPGFNLDNTIGGKTALSNFSGTPVLLFFHMAVG
jgi:hypothetical protein